MDKENIKDYILYDSERDFLTVRQRRRGIIVLAIMSAFICIFGLACGSLITVSAQIVLTVSAVICIYIKTGKGYKNTYPEHLFVQGFHMCYMSVSFTVFAFIMLDFFGKSDAMYKLLIALVEILFLLAFYSVVFLLIRKGTFQDKKKTRWSSITKCATVIIVATYGWPRIFLNDVPEEKIREILIVLLVLVSFSVIPQTQDLLRYYFIKKYYPTTWVDSNL